jgi:hypothetical protein
MKEVIEMSKKWFLWRVLAFLFLVILLVAGGGAIAYFAWSQGYATGQSAAAGEGVAAPPPYPPYAFGHPGHFGFVGPLLCVGVLLLLFVAIGGLFRMLAWRRMWACGPGPMWHHGGPHPRQAAHWARHWRHHGPMPPCCQGWDEPCDEEAGEAGAKPDAEE